LHYDKREILETYLNEIYLAQDNGRAIHGVGLASHYFFGKRVQELSLPEAALLVGMVKGPSLYDPRKHPVRARERRDLVIAEMAKLNMLPADEATQARAAPLAVLDRPAMGTTPYPAFLDLVRRQLRNDYRDEDLRSEGLRIFTTLDPAVQTAAEQALALRLAQLDRTHKAARPLEGAVVVSDVQSGEVQALVGGRDPRFAGYNRALDSQRSIGSLMKPVVYLTALADPKNYTLITPIDDSPLVWKSRGAPDWKPQNYDKKNHGEVPLRLALAHSHNVSTARLGINVGIERVLENARRLGIERDMPPYASSLLGAVGLSPFEVTQMYQTIASGGFRTPLRAIREVLTVEGRPVTRYGLSVEQVIEPEPVYLLTSAMQDTVREGTAAGMKEFLPSALAAAGKTGTTDDLRDAWFAGFTGNRAAVVWVGYDDNSPAHLTGASGAMPVWGELMRRLDPEPLAPPLPEGIERVWIEPATGLRADEHCPGAVEMSFAKGSAPETLAACVRPVEAPRKSWWQRLFQ
ncbi:MAG: penicillin-binding transpeptidase domain-containing protein, partial [Gammaproteobacteria bacterium]|nr:penicillin-binding transpeptidase domain-containing protein [Gammaproteobacteria bacterium]